MEKYKERLNLILKNLGWDSRNFKIDGRELGNTNTSFFCTYKDCEYILRFGTDMAEKISINRNNEQKTISMLKGKPYAIETVYFNNTTGDMLSKCNAKKDITEDIYNSDKFLIDVAELLNSFHDHKTDYFFNSFKDIKNRLDFLQIPPKNIMPIYSKYENIAKKYSQSQFKHIVFCHNDTYLTNFKYDNNGNLHIVDYEFSAMGDVFFDLAGIVFCGKEPWNTDKIKQFLQLTVKDNSSEAVKKIYDYNIIQLMWNYTWAKVNALQNPQKFNKLAQEYFQKILNAPNIP